VAKRFTSTEKWKKKWIRELKPEHKLFWFYLLDNCDHAGIWEVDIDLASFQIGVDLDEQEVLAAFNRKIVQFKDGKWFVPKFIEYQYGELNEKVNAHKSVIKILQKYGLNKIIKHLPNTSPSVLSTELSSVQDIYMDKDKDKDKEKKRKSKKEQLKEIKDNLVTYENDFPRLNIEFYYNSFVDWLSASDKRYKNYSSAFRNCCRQEWYKNTSGSYKEEEKKDNMILAGCSKGCYKRKIKPGVYAYCPECREQLVEI
jgi:hypothetical protein